MLKFISYCGLALSLIPALMVYHGTITKETYYNLMILGMILWFSTAIFWVKPDHSMD